MMRSTLACGALVAALLGPPAAGAQGSFEGLVVYKVSDAEGKSGLMRYYQLGNRTRQEFEMNGVAAVSIFDGTTGDIITLVPQQKQYLVMNMKQLGQKMGDMAQALQGQKRATGDLSKMKVTATGKSETIAGISCAHYLFASTDEGGRGPVDVCGATGMGFMGVGDQASSAMPSTAGLLHSSNPELARIARGGFFPLKITTPEGAGGRSAVFEATQVDRHRPDAALFQPPAGYTKLTLPAMPGMKP